MNEPCGTAGQKRSSTGTREVFLNHSKCSYPYSAILGPVASNEVYVIQLYIARLQQNAFSIFTPPFTNAAVHGYPDHFFNGFLLPFAYSVNQIENFQMTAYLLCSTQLAYHDTATTEICPASQPASQLPKTGSLVAKSIAPSIFTNSRTKVNR